jgi:polysaccharide biosynthesis PFTS motif protein
MGHKNRVSNFLNVGCLWSEHIRDISDKEAYEEPLGSIRLECKKNHKKIISVFDTSFGGQSFLNSDDMECFLKGILRLSEERRDLFFIIKPKFALDIGRIKFSKILAYYKDMMTRQDFYVFEDLCDPSGLIAVSDLSISACFSSTTKEAWGTRKKAIYYDATGLWRGAPSDYLPCIVAHSYEKLAAFVDYWLYKITDKEWDVYIEKYIRPGIDPYCDGRGITRFRELLIK